MTELEKVLQAAADGDAAPKVRWTCECGAENVRIDNGRGRQWETCVCGQGIILLNMSREDWID